MRSGRARLATRTRPGYADVMMKTLRCRTPHLFSAAALAITVALAGPAQAQQEVVQALPDSGAAQRLSESLRVLESNSTDVLALVAAGNAALDLDDANAAYGFFARARVVSQRNPQVEVGLGRTLVRLERADEALGHFALARSLGANEREFAADRGLAHDVRGDYAAAQADYQLALQAGFNDETIRRLALSQAIGGDARTALSTLAPLVARNDPASWRARAFVLAMDGDLGGARGVASARMSPGMAGLFDRFFARLPALNPAERARAVHFGDMPADGTRYASARPGSDQVASATNTRPPPRGQVRRGAGEALIPQGPPLTRQQRSSRDRLTQRAASDRRSNERRSAASELPARTRTQGTRSATPTRQATAPIRVAAATPAPIPPPMREMSLPTATPDAVFVANSTPAPAPLVTASASPAVLSQSTTPEATGRVTLVPSVAAAAQSGSGGLQRSVPLSADPTVEPRPGLSTDPRSVVVQPGSIERVDPAEVLRPGDQLFRPDGTSSGAVGAPDVVPSVAPTLSTDEPPLSVSVPVIQETAEADRLAAEARLEAEAEARAAAEAKAKAAAAAKVKADAAAKAKADVAAKAKAEAAAKAKTDAAAKAKTDAAAKAKADSKAKEEAAAKAKAAAIPERYWFQIASGADVRALAGDLKRHKRQHSILAKLEGVTSEWGKMRRLVVGPFKTMAEAKAFEAKAKADKLDGYVWVSPEGFEVDPLPGQ